MGKLLKIVSMVLAVILIPDNAVHAEKVAILESNAKYLPHNIFYDSCNKIALNNKYKVPQQIVSEYYIKSLSYEGRPAKFFNLNCIIKFYDKKNLVSYAEDEEIIASYVLFFDERHDDVEVCKSKYILNIEKILSEYEGKSFSGAVGDAGGYLPDIAIAVASVRHECGDDDASHYYHIAILVGGKPFYDEYSQLAVPVVHAPPEKDSQN